MAPLLFFLAGISFHQPSILFPNADEARAGWIALWDGTLSDWQTHPEWKPSTRGGLVVGKGTGRTRCWLGAGEWKLRLGISNPSEGALKATWIQQGQQTPLASWTKSDGQVFEFRSPQGRAGQLGLEGAGVEVLSIWHKPKATIDLIAGKNLSGWELVPGKKSKVVATPEGWIRIQDGPGDLQSEGSYGDFIAQLTLRTGGKHLNSGFFFRAIPGEQWQGYEAQIRNEFTPGIKRPYMVETFDANSHQPTGKQEVESTAVDFGSGAIYRRMPARSQAANDHEWFTLTVSAVGRDICTWVQGQPQVSWTDNRPENNNARQGFRSKAGVFGIQGHDPTTLIDFRSLRLCPLD
jgi:hypothetical protein